MFSRGVTEFSPISIGCNQKNLRRGDKSLLVLSLGIPEGYHIQANMPAEDFFVPMELIFKAAEGLSIGEPFFPEPQPGEVEWSEVKLLTYGGTIQVAVPIEVAAEKDGPVELRGCLSFQGCTESRCLPPAKQDFVLALEIN